MGAAPSTAKPPALTKKQLEGLISDLYRQLSYKQGQACDSVPFQHDKEKIFQQYDKMRDKLREITSELMYAGGFE